MKYLCEKCNKQYNSQEEAIKCEMEHEKEAEIAASRGAADRKISDAVNAYIAKFKAMPAVKINAENEDIIYDSLRSEICKVFDMLF